MPDIPVKPERPKVRYFHDEQELSPADVDILHLNKSKSTNVKNLCSPNEKPVRPVRPLVQYR